MTKPQLALVPGQLELVRPPAPGQLELVRRFLNTIDLAHDRDVMSSPETYTAWLREYGLLERGSKVGPEDVERAREVRECLRSMARANNGARCSSETALLSEASERAKLVFDFDGAAGSCRLRSNATGADAAVGTILAGVHSAMLERSWPRLKLCADEACEWTYFDHSKNGCSRWCSAETCGNRNKVRRYRERQAKGPESTEAETLAVEAAISTGRRPRK